MNNMDIKSLYIQRFNREPKEITRLPGAGSSRRYYRIVNPDGSTLIGTEGDSLVENGTFLKTGKALKDKGMPVPEIISEAPDYSCYIQEDFGDTALFDAIADGRASGNFSEAEKSLLKDAVKMLCKVQIEGGRGFDYSLCHPYEQMDRRMVCWDLNSFKYSFLKPALGEVDDAALQQEFDALQERLLEGMTQWDTLMIRDFQSRNIMVTQQGLRLIDFQGCRRGPLAYDLVSLLWQAKANLPQRLRDELTDYYIAEANRLGAGLEPDKFRGEVTVFALFRIMQTLGAYGFRGLVQGKQHFIESIPAGVGNLNAAVEQLGEQYPYLRSLAVKLADKFKPQVAEPGLTVTVGSFSYKKGYPADPSGNGGGFVFDCRAIHNPGRYEQYKRLTGRDKAVRDFLEDDGEVLVFLSNAEAMVGASVEKYLKRGFNSLAVWFGCTGGQHRSVYCAETMGRYLNERYGVRVRLIHREQNIEETLAARNI